MIIDIAGKVVGGWPWQGGVDRPSIYTPDNRSGTVTRFSNRWQWLYLKRPLIDGGGATLSRPGCDPLKPLLILIDVTIELSRYGVGRSSSAQCANCSYVAIFLCLLIVAWSWLWIRQSLKPIGFNTCPTRVDIQWFLGIFDRGCDWDKV